MHEKKGKMYGKRPDYWRGYSEQWSKFKHVRSMASRRMGCSPSWRLVGPLMEWPVPRGRLSSRSCSPETKFVWMGKWGIRKMQKIGRKIWAKHLLENAFNKRASGEASQKMGEQSLRQWPVFSCFLYEFRSFRLIQKDSEHIFSKKKSRVRKIKRHACLMDFSTICEKSSFVYFFYIFPHFVPYAIKC